MISVCKAEMHITDWAKVQSQDQYIPIVMKRIDGKKKDRLCKLLGDLATTSEGRSYLAKRKGFQLWRRMLYLCTKPRGDMEDIDVFVVLKDTRSGPWMGVIKMWGTKVRHGHWPYIRRGFGGPGCLAKATTWCKGANGVNCLRECRLGLLCRVSGQPPPRTSACQFHHHQEGHWSEETNNVAECAGHNGSLHQIFYGSSLPWS